MARWRESLKEQHEKEIPDNDFRIRKIEQLLNKQAPERRALLMESLETKQLFLSTKEFAKRLGIPEQRVRQWLRKGLIKGKKVSRSWLVRASEIDRLLSEDDE